MLRIILYILSWFVVGTTLLADCTTKTSEKEVTDQYVIDTATPAWLKGATITVTQADGRSSTVPAERFKVVPRKQQFIQKATVQKRITACNQTDKNRISIMGGHGPKGNLERKDSTAKTEVSTETGFVGGIQYQRNLTPHFSIGGQVQSNGTAGALIGVDF